MPEQTDYFTPALMELNTKIRDLEERQKLIKERTILIGENLIEEREKNQEDIVELRTQLLELTEENNKLKRLMQRVIGEIDKTAKKDDIELLRKQAKMFQPLDLITKSELSKILKAK